MTFAHVDVVNAEGKTVRGKFTEEIQRTCKVTLEAYRAESYKILQIFQRFASKVERASIDEAFLDLTAECDARIATWRAAHTDLDGNCSDEEIDDEDEANESSAQWVNWAGADVIGDQFVPKCDSDLRLMFGSQLVDEIRKAVERELGYTCSAGVSFSKKFAKLISSNNKPNGQTVLPSRGLPLVFAQVPFRKMQGFGGKLGVALAEMGVETFADVTKTLSLSMLIQQFGESTGSWIWRVCHGIETEEVKPVEKIKRFLCSKNLRGVSDRSEMMIHLRVIASELIVRMLSDRQQWNRVPQNLVVHYRTTENSHSVSTQMPFLPPDDQMKSDEAHDKYANNLVAIADKLLPKNPMLVYLNIGLAADRFIEAPRMNITRFFSQQVTRPPKRNLEEKETVDDDVTMGEKTVQAAVENNRKKKKRSLDDFLEKASHSGSDRKRRRISPDAEPTDKIEEEQSDGEGVVVCKKCGESVVATETQTHEDMHVAQELSSQLNGPGVLHSPAKRKKNKKKTKGTIQGFFRKV